MDRLLSEFPLINAVINKQQQGRLYRFGEDIFVLHKAGFSFWTSTDKAKTEVLLDFLVTNTEVPVYFHIYDASPELIELCEAKNDQLNIRLRKRLQLQYLSKQVSEVHCPQGFYIKAVTSDNIADMQVFGLQLGEKFWSSSMDFLTNGFGFCVVEQQTNLPASICYTACVSEGVAEVDVATLPAFQQKGLAKAAVSSYVQLCISYNITANWDCFVENVASLKIAQGLGFQPVDEYLFLSVFNKVR